MDPENDNSESFADDDESILNSVENSNDTDALVQKVSNQNGVSSEDTPIRLKIKKMNGSNTVQDFDQNTTLTSMVEHSDNGNKYFI